jgi:hypothetical protein
MKFACIRVEKTSLYERTESVQRSMFEQKLFIVSRNGKVQCLVFIRRVVAPILLVHKSSFDQVHVPVSHAVVHELSRKVKRGRLPVQRIVREEVEDLVSDICLVQAHRNTEGLGDIAGGSSHLVPRLDMRLSFDVRSEIGENGNKNFGLVRSYSRLYSVGKKLSGSFIEIGGLPDACDQ